MHRENFQRELDRLVLGIADFGWEVEGYLGTMVGAVENHDARGAGECLGNDARFKLQGDRIEEQCLIFQARQAPVARDLRLVHAMRAITNHVVRAGTLCEHVFRTVAETPGEARVGSLENAVPEMARMTHQVFRGGLEMFEHRDLAVFRNLRVANDRVGLLRAEVIRLIADPSCERFVSPQLWVRLALMVRYLERIADHGVGIGERTSWLAIGRPAESSTHRSAG